MSLHISKNGIRATGNDANGLFIALMPDEVLVKAGETKMGDRNFQRMVEEAIVARGLPLPPSLSPLPSVQPPEAA
jgi:hypothetical protein